MRVVALACLVLAGCASRPPPHYITPDEARQMSAAELCLGLSNWPAPAARSAEIAIYERRINCADHTAGMQALQAQQAAAIGAFLNRPAPTPLQIAPVPYQVQPTAQCRTWWDGAGYRTTCQ